MKQEQMTEIMMLAKRTGTLLHEVMEVSRQLAEAIDRRDEVSMRMVIAMRAEPIEKLTNTTRALRELLMTLDDGEEAARLRAILNGDETRAVSEQEKLLAEQAGANLRAHSRVMELDETLNRKIGKDRSLYNRE